LKAKRATVNPATTEVKVLDDYNLLLTFEDGGRRVFDVKPYLDMGVFRELKDPTLFGSARISFDSVEWANGADLCPEVLFSDSIPVEM
jgi:hypothetical protein